MDTNKSLSQNVIPNSTGLFWVNGDETIEVTTADRNFMSQIRKLSKVNSDVVIDQEPNQENGGFMLALIPRECLKLGNKRHIELSEDRKKALAERLKKSRI